MASIRRLRHLNAAVQPPQIHQPPPIPSVGFSLLSSAVSVVVSSHKECRRWEVLSDRLLVRQSPTTITDVRAYAIKLPDIRMICVVKITTAGGEYGVGESGLSFRELAVKGVSLLPARAAGAAAGSCCGLLSRGGCRRCCSPLRLTPYGVSICWRC